MSRVQLSISVSDLGAAVASWTRLRGAAPAVHTPDSVGFIGLGDQGAPMTQALADRSYELHVWARNQACLDALDGYPYITHPDPATLTRAVDVLALCVTDDDGVREITPSADATAAFRLGQIAVNHGTGDPQLHERGKHAAGRLADTAHLLARPAGARS